MHVSVIIANYNYGRFLADAVDSVLAQSYPDVELIVVDDGSDDDSLAVLARYGTRLQVLTRQRSGQAAACNAGFARSRGDVVIFLDSDDRLLPDAVAQHVLRLRDGRAVKSCGYMAVVDESGRRLGPRVPRRLPRSGDYRDVTLRRGIDSFDTSFTSAHAWRRSFLEAVMPLPEDRVLGVDGYLTAVDRLFGPLEFVDACVAEYRRHDANHGPARFSYDAPYLRMRLQRKYYRMAYAEAWAQRLGYQVDPEQFWKVRDWRIVLMAHILERWGEPPQDHQRAMTAGDFVLSPFQSHRPSRWMSAAVSLGLGSIRLLPPPLDLRLAQHLLQHAQARRPSVVGQRLTAPDGREVQNS